MTGDFKAIDHITGHLLLRRLKVEQFSALFQVLTFSTKCPVV